jgi:hypothetical protein
MSGADGRLLWTYRATSRLQQQKCGVKERSSNMKIMVLVDDVECNEPPRPIRGRFMEARARVQAMFRLL